MTTPAHAHKYRAIVFDNAGVLEFSGSRNPVEIAAEQLNVPVEDFRKEYFKYNHLSNAENMPWGEMFAHVLSAFNAPTEVQEGILRITDDDGNKKKQNAELISKLPGLKE